MWKQTLAALAVGLALAAPLAAQWDDPIGVKPTNSKQMYEDIEVMRRLMARNLHTFTHDCQVCHTAKVHSEGLLRDITGGGLLTGGLAGDGLVDFNGDGVLDLWLVNHPQVGGKLPPVEGTYLKGYGAVFAVTLPPLVHLAPAPAAAPKPPNKVLSDWEQTRLQMQGQKSPERSAASQPPSLSNLLLQLLAENGKHFGQLSPAESVTLVVTFRTEPPTSGAAGGPREPGPGMPGGGPGMPGSPSAPVPAGPGGAGGPMPGPGASGGPGMPPGGGATAVALDDLELLAEMHRKQGNWKEVAHAYELALRKRPKARELSLKLATAYLELGQIEEAKKVLNGIDPTKPDVTRTKTIDVKDAPPYKLIVSAPKSVLDQVGAGKMTFEEFVKKASVETVTK